MSSDCRTRIGRADITEEGVQTQWGDGHCSRFHWIWLRHLCECGDCGTSANAVRDFRLHHYSADIAVASLARENGGLSVVWTGDSGIMFTLAQRVTAAEPGLPPAIVIWENGGLKQIQDDMDGRQIERVGIEGINPDFVAPARACHCHGAGVADLDELQGAFQEPLHADRPTVIALHEQRD